MKKMGSFSSLIGMMPGANKVASQVDDQKVGKEMSRMEAIIMSMTPAERKKYEIIDGSRRRRIAKGSGTSVEQVNLLLKQYAQMQKMMKKMSKMGPGALKSLGGLGNLAGLGKKMPF